MSRNSDPKTTVWRNIFQLIVPHKKRFIWVVVLSLLGTGASLIEPLIYREAINDVAGVFVKQAKDSVRHEFNLISQQDELIPSTDTVPVNAPKDSVIKKKIAGKRASARERKRQAKPKVIEPHTASHVASRSPEQALDTLLWAVFYLFLINFIGTIIWRIGENTNVKLSCYIEQHFIQSTFAHVLNLPLSFFSKRTTAALSKQIDQSEEVSSVVNGISQQILPELISLAGILAIMFWQNLTLTAIALIIVPFYLLIAWRSAKRLESGLSGYYEKWEEVFSRIQDGIAGIKTVKLSGAENREIEILDHDADKAYFDYIKRSKLGNKYVFWETMLTHVSTALVLGYGGYLTLQNKITPGDVVMFVAYLDRLYSPIDSLASLWVTLQQNIASIARAFRLLDFKMEKRSGSRLSMRAGRIEFRDVHFGYNPDREILKGISIIFEPGKITAIVGPSGAGKTTTVDLLVKLYEPDSGQILIDGQNIGELDADSVRQQIGVVATDGVVFRGTLADNIRYKRPAASADEVQKAAYSAGLNSALERLPEGLQTVVGESGIGLSVGERQRLQIARVLAAQPKILILDEATANLDFATELEIKKTVDAIRKQTTIIIIAHRYSMVRDADKVIVISDGEVREQGSPQQLIEKGGWFAAFSRASEDEPTGDEESEESGDESEES
ncbi:MAG TPA: ABC transporter ATP-binding protein [Puia sp.]|nr:ABC transporter ATP-binding protein [Puia sp.]